MRWHKANRYAPSALALADRHYNRQKPGTPQFSPPGRLLVLLTPSADAVWTTVWSRFAKHAWPGAWNNALFRNESIMLSSLLITDAVAATLAHFGAPPSNGMITFIDPAKVRHKRDPGRCYLKAGFRYVGDTDKGLRVLQLSPADMPPPSFAHGAQLQLFPNKNSSDISPH